MLLNKLKVDIKYSWKWVQILLKKRSKRVILLESLNAAAEYFQVVACREECKEVSAGCQRRLRVASRAGVRRRGADLDAAGEAHFGARLEDVESRVAGRQTRHPRADLERAHVMHAVGKHEEKGARVVAAPLPLVPVAGAFALEPSEFSEFRIFRGAARGFGYAASAPASSR